MVANVIVGITRNIEDLHVGPEAAEFEGELMPIHVGHDDIGHEKMNRGIVFLGEIERLNSIARAENIVTLVLQNFADEFADDIFVLDDQHGLEVVRFFHRCQRCAAEIDRRGFLWQVNPEGAAFPEFALHGDAAAGLPDNPIHGGKTESRSLARALGGEERFENMGFCCLIHARAGIGHGKDDIIARLE